MNRTTIDFGIDLGTTNSAIAVFTGNRGEPTKIIKNTTDGSDADITPSALYINKKGTQRTGEIIDAAVITVPAAFELHQCDATRKAAELTGFKQSPLLQEPVAAALAYGFQTDSDRTFWLV